MLLTERPAVCAGRNGIKAGDYNGIFAEVWGKEEKKHKTKKKWRRKLNLPSPKSCWLCVHCRSCGLQQLPFITMQNNPLFVQRNRIAALKKRKRKRKHRLTLFCSFSICKRPWAVALFSVPLCKKDVSLCSVWYLSVHCLQQELFFTTRFLAYELQDLVPLYPELSWGFLEHDTVAYCSRSSPVQYVGCLCRPVPPDNMELHG